MSYKLKKWHEAYAHGSKHGDEEKKVFTGADGKSGLARSPYKWRSVDSIAKEAKLSKSRVEEILEKYLKHGIVLQKPDNPELFGYWEIVAPDANNAPRPSIANEDQKRRVDETKGPVKTLKKKSSKSDQAIGSVPATAKAAPAPVQAAPVAAGTP